MYIKNIIEKTSKKVKAAFGLAIAEMVIDELKSDQIGYQLAKEALKLSWEWIEKENISGAILAEYVAEEDIPAEFIPSVQRGIQRAAQDEEMDGAAIINLKVTVVGGSFHPVDSSSFAYEIAALKAFKQALPAAELISVCIKN